MKHRRAADAVSTAPVSLVERWNGWYERRQQEVAESVAGQLLPARRLAFLLYGDWPAADRAVTAAVGRYAISGDPRRWGDRTPPVLRDAIILRYLTGYGPRGWPWRFATLLVAWGKLGWVRGRGLLPSDRRRSEADRAPARVLTGREVLGQALGEVSPQQRAVLVCRHYEGLDLATTANLLGWSEEAVSLEAEAGARALAAAIAARRDAAVRATSGPVVTGSVVTEPAPADPCAAEPAPGDLRTAESAPGGARAAESPPAGLSVTDARTAAKPVVLDGEAY